MQVEDIKTKQFCNSITGTGGGWRSSLVPFIQEESSANMEILFNQSLTNWYFSIMYHGCHQLFLTKWRMNWRSRCACRCDERNVERTVGPLKEDTLGHPRPRVRLAAQLKYPKVVSLYFFTSFSVSLGQLGCMPLVFQKGTLWLHHFSTFLEMHEFFYIAFDHVLFGSMHVGDCQRFAEIPRDPQKISRESQRFPKIVRDCQRF